MAPAAVQSVASSASTLPVVNPTGYQPKTNADREIDRRKPYRPGAPSIADWPRPQVQTPEREITDAQHVQIEDPSEPGSKRHKSERNETRRDKERRGRIRGCRDQNGAELGFDLSNAQAAQLLIDGHRTSTGLEGGGPRRRPKHPPARAYHPTPAAPRAFCIWLYPYPAFLRYAAHSAGGYWARILPLASEIAS